MIVHGIKFHASVRQVLRWDAYAGMYGIEAHRTTDGVHLRLNRGNQDNIVAATSGADFPEAVAKLLSGRFDWTDKRQEDVLGVAVSMFHKR